MTATISPSSNSRDLEGIRILVADDSPDNQYLLNRVLNRKGAIVSVADDGVDACNLALAEHFDVLLMDIQMPILDGFGAMERLKNAGYSRSVLAVTASSKDEDRDSLLAAGFAGRVKKPVDPAVLTAMIKEALAANVSAENKA